MVTQSEAVLEKCLIDKLVDGGYKRVKISDKTDLEKNLKSQLEIFNKVTLTDDEFNKILLYLESGSIFDKSKKLRDKYVVKRDDETVYIQFFNSKDWCKNLFQVTNQITMDEVYKNRYDVTLLLNGFPLVQIELKKRGVELKVAFNQIQRYRHHSYRGLFQYIQIFVISNGVNTKYFANNKELSYKYTFSWKDETNRNISSLDKFADTFLEKCHLSKMISKYTVLNETNRALMVLRSYQYYAVESILNKALNTPHNGYVWHTTGSGKTLTSFKVSQLLSEEEGIDKIIFVVDRKDLDYQTFKEFNSFSTGSVDTTDKTITLVKQLLGPNKLIITTIQKLYRAVAKHKKIEQLKDQKIILMFDECHRSQFGKMHDVITTFFINLQYFGFTGTPIFSTNSIDGMTTKSLFQNRLHTYVIQDAIKDGNVLGFSVEYHGKHKNKTKLDIEVEDIDRKELMESEDRLQKIVDYIILNHDIKTYNREFNAIFAVNSIEVLNKYYELFKRKDHDLKIATIYSYDANEEIKGDKHSRDKLESHIIDYNKMFGTNFSTDTFQEYYIDISKKVKEKKIDILLVVNMFLTGFDSKFLNTLYVDKNLQYQGLLQAYSRTNRILNEKKSFGNIICFRNLKKATDESIKLYSDENAPEDVLAKPYTQYAMEFNQVLIELNKITPEVQDVDKLPSELEESQFVKIFRELLRIITKMKVFTEFSFKDLDIPEQKFNDFQSKYLDLYEKVNGTGSEKVSVLDDVDFELELIRRDNINVAYILSLLKDLDFDDPSFDEDKKFIKDTMERTHELRSKIDLIDKFIEQNIPEIKDKNEIEYHFEEFIDKEKNNAISKFIQNENLDDKIAKGVIAEYEFSGKLRNDALKESFNESYKFKEKRSKLIRIKEDIINLVNKFSW